MVASTRLGARTTSTPPSPCARTTARSRAAAPLPTANGTREGSTGEPRPVCLTRANFEAEDAFPAGDRYVQLWRYDWGDGHVRGVDVFRLRDGKVAEKLSYVKG